MPKSVQGKSELNSFWINETKIWKDGVMLIYIPNINGYIFSA